MVSLYLDENVPGPVTVGLRRRGVDVLTVYEDDRAGAADVDVLNRAGELSRLVFTQDDDFLIETQRRQNTGEPFVGVFYVHQGHLSFGEMISELEIIALASEPAEYANRVVYLPL